MIDRDIQIALVFSVEGENFHLGEASDILAQTSVNQTVSCLAETIMSLGYPVIELPVKTSLEQFKQHLLTLSPAQTFIFNLCDGYGGTSDGAACVVQVMEELGFHHTGASAQVIAHCTHKGRAKSRLLAFGVPTPPFQIFKEPKGDIKVRFPLIVKPITEDASLGIDFPSVVNNSKDLYNRIEYILAQYHQPALVEEFIPGREFAVSMWGNGANIEVLPISEEDYSAIHDPLKRLLVYEAKWVPESWYYRNIPVVSPARLTRSQEDAIIHTSLAAYKAIGLRDLGRVDIRYDDDTPYIIDINDIPDLTPESGFPHSAEVGGYTYVGMVEKILEIAFTRECWR